MSVDTPTRSAKITESGSPQGEQAGPPDGADFLVVSP
jgi:hypothetical protein